MSSDDTDESFELNRRTFVGLTGAGIVGSALPGSATASNGGDGGPPSSGDDGHDPVAEITLVTGDRVHVIEVEDDGEWTVSIDPADREGYEPSFETEEHGDDVYVVPSDAAPLIPDTLDRELFNVRKLAEVASHTEAGTTPTIVSLPGGASANALATTAGVASTRELSSIDAAAVTVDSETFWREVTAASDGAGVASADALSGVEKVWLDGPVTAELDDSIDQVGAPVAWDTGYDGEGVTIAVLDTGIDESHPDVGDKVVEAENFSSDDTTDDLYGHGTHVASIAAGTGAASDGDRTGVAPGADLLNGKVLNESGSGSESGIIAGMEWAAQQGADVINMSLGGGATDGTDPLSQAVDNLTDAHGTVFVVSAGNSGPGDQSVTTPGSADAAVTAGAVDKDGELANFSSRGPRVDDYAVKPDLTAPGVAIAAARADDTSLGSPVDDDYTEASGTSMSAPHVAGAMSILVQQRGTVDAEELKSTVASTASVSDDLTVYEQGGGELDVAAAVETDVVATPAPFDLGYHEYPHDDADPVTETLTFTNHGDETAELDLAIDLADEDGDSPADGMVTVDPASVTVAAGESVDVDVILDLAAGETGLYGGWLAASEDGETVATVPAGFYKEGEMYDLTIHGTMRDGRTARRASSLEVINVDDRDEFFQSVSFDDGVATARVPSGTYSAMGVITTLDQDDAFFEERTLIGDPEFEITGDTELTLDAREADSIVVDTMHDELARPGGSITYHREPEEGLSYTHTWSGDTPISAASTDSVSQGYFEMFSEHTLIKPPLITRAVEPDELEVDAEYMTDSPELDEGTFEWELVPAGLGYPEDFEEIDVEGEMALIQRGEFSFADKAKNAYEAGAEAAIIYNNEPEDFNGTLAGEGVIPTFELSGEEGQALLDLTDDGDATFQVVATPQSPFQYDLLLPEKGSIPDDLQYNIDEGDVGTIDAGYYSDVPDKEINIGHANWRPYQTVTFTFTDRDEAPQQRTEYISANDTRWQKTVYMEPAFDGGLSEPQTFYEGGEHREKVWHKQVSSPGLIEGAEHFPSDLPIRDGDTLDLTIPEWSDAQRGEHRHWGWRDLGDDETAFRLYENGDLVAEDDRALGTFDVSGDSRLRLELDVARDRDWWDTSTETATAWEFDSEPTDASEPLPLVMVDYDVDLNLRNQYPHPRDQRGQPGFDIHVRHPRGVEGSDVAGARVWTSHDDGDSWRERNVRHQGDGHFHVRTDNRDPDDTETGYVSLRVEAWDEDGNRIEQEIVRAYALTPRD